MERCDAETTTADDASARWFAPARAVSRTYQTQGATDMERWDAEITTTDDA